MFACPCGNNKDSNNRNNSPCSTKIIDKNSNNAFFER